MATPQHANMKFYMTPGSCSTGIHILLEELELPFEVTIVNLPAGEHRKPEYLAINPKGTIPTLVCRDGRALTEFQAIAFWLARTHPRAALLPADDFDAARAVELMDYAVGTIHGQGYTRIFTTSVYLPQDAGEAQRAAVKARGEAIVADGFAVVDAQLRDEGYALGAFSIADAALFYVEFWADKLGIALPPRCAAHYRRMLERPAVRRVLLEEGYRF